MSTEGHPKMKQNAAFNKEERLIDESFCLLPGCDSYHIFFEASVDTPEVTYKFKYTIYVDEQSYALLDDGDPENKTKPKFEIVDEISEFATLRMVDVIKYKKCCKCNKKEYDFMCRRSFVDPYKALVPTIALKILIPTCSECRQDVMNSQLDDLKDSLNFFKTCDGECGKQDFKMKCCERCRSVFYCSRECQRRHWKLEHKKYCKPYEKKT